MVLPKLSNIGDSFPNYSSVPLRERKRTYLALPLGCEMLRGSGVELETSVGCMHSCPGERWWELSEKVWRKWSARDKSEIRRCKKKSLAVRLDTWERGINIRPEFFLPIKLTLASSSSKLVFCFCVLGNILSYNKMEGQLPCKATLLIAKMASCKVHVL